MNRTLILAGIAACADHGVSRRPGRPSSRARTGTSAAPGRRQVRAGRRIAGLPGRQVDRDHVRPAAQTRTRPVGVGRRLREEAERRRAGLARGRQRHRRGSRREVPLVINGKTVARRRVHAVHRSQAEQLDADRVALGGHRRRSPSTKDALFGAYDYTPDKDVVRTPMKIETLPYSVEQLTWSFADMSETGGRLVLTWDKVMASVPFTVGK